jgi:predicted nucleic acid-binding protein
MTSYSETPPAIVVDANIAVRAVLPTEEKAGILERFANWHQSRSNIYAPDILLPEAVSVIRRGIYDRWITEAEGQIAVEDVFRLGVEVIPSDVGICQSALTWAARLGQAKAYDGFYLAVAERMEAELWTADERLRNRVRQLGVSWVRWVGEE